MRATLARARSTRDASGRLLQPTCQRRAPALRGVTLGSPRVSRAIHAPGTRFRPATFARCGFVRPALKRCHRTSGASVIGSSGGLAPASTANQARFLRRPVKADTLPRTETPSVEQRGLAPFPGSAARKPLVRSRHPFADCGFPRTARPPSTAPAATGAASDGQASPADFCNQPRSTGTTYERLLLERTPLGALSVARISRVAPVSSLERQRVSRSSWSRERPSAGRAAPREHAHCDAVALSLQPEHPLSLPPRAPNLDVRR